MVEAQGTRSLWVGLLCPLTCQSHCIVRCCLSLCLCLSLRHPIDGACLRNRRKRRLRETRQRGSGFLHTRPRAGGPGRATCTRPSLSCNGDRRLDLCTRLSDPQPTNHSLLRTTPCPCCSIIITSRSPVSSPLIFRIITIVFLARPNDPRHPL